MVKKAVRVNFWFGPWLRLLMSFSEYVFLFQLAEPLVCIAVQWVHLNSPAKGCDSQVALFGSVSKRKEGSC